MMNCQDISRILDEGEITALPETEIGELEAHLSQCADCAGLCQASERLATFRSEVPPMPESLAERARQLYELRESKPSLGRTRRPVIIGSLLLLGAAATMFAPVPRGDSRTVSQ